MKLRLIALLASAVALLMVSVLGVTRGARASAAYALYHHARYGRGSESVPGVLASCAASYRYYPYNYYFAMLAAERAYYSASDGTGDDDWGRRDSAAEYWCDTGLQLNPYRMKLRLIKAGMIAKDSPSEAVEYWKAYVDWHYWEPFNHCALAEFHARAGDFDLAFETLETIKGMSYYEEGLKRVNAQWRKEMEMPER